MKIAKRYKKEQVIIDKLATKIIAGGGGVWGPHVMAPHPKLTQKEATEMVNYILSLH